VNKLSSISTAEIGWTAWALSIVSTLTSLSPTPPILPSFTSSASAYTEVSIGKAGSTRAHSKMPIVLIPASTLTASSTNARIPSELPFGPPFYVESTCDAEDDLIPAFGVFFEENISGDGGNLLEVCRNVYP